MTCEVQDFNVTLNSLLWNTSWEFFVLNIFLVHLINYHLLTLVERKTWFAIIRKIKSKNTR